MLINIRALENIDPSDSMGIPKEVLEEDSEFEGLLTKSKYIRV